MTVVVDPLGVEALEGLEQALDPVGGNHRPGVGQDRTARPERVPDATPTRPPDSL